MKRLEANLSVLTMFLFILYGCVQKTTSINVESEKKAIQELYNNRYYKGVNDNDLELFMTSWANDATRMEADFFPIVGKEKIKAHFRKIADSSLDGWKIKQYGDIEIEVRDDLAFARGAVTIQGISAADGSEVFKDIKWLDILKKQSDGSWEIYIDCVNFNPDVSKEPDTLDPGEDGSLDPAL